MYYIQHGRIPGLMRLQCRNCFNMAVMWTIFRGLTITCSCYDSLQCLRLLLIKQVHINVPRILEGH